MPFPGNSRATGVAEGRFGNNWSTNFSSTVRSNVNSTYSPEQIVTRYTLDDAGHWFPRVFWTNPTLFYATVDRPDGLQVYFTKNAITGSWVADSDVDDKLVQFTDSFGVTVSWRYTSGNDDVENYDATGKLLSISNHAGLRQTLSYDGSGRITTVTDAFNRQLGFTYDASNRIATMTDSAGGVFI